MTLALAFLIVVITVPLAGGRLDRLGEVRVRWLWLAALAFALQVLIVTVIPEGDTAVHRVAHLGSYALVGACALRNLGELRFLWVVVLGGALNLVAIAANGGVMPASEGALESAGLVAQLGRVRQLRRSRGSQRRLPRRRVRDPRRLAGGERLQRGRCTDARGRLPRPARNHRLAPGISDRAPSILDKRPPMVPPRELAAKLVTALVKAPAEPL